MSKFLVRGVWFPRRVNARRARRPGRHSICSVARQASLTFLFAVVSTSSRADTVYVDDDAPLGGDGTSWASAFLYLQDALAIAAPGDEIRVARGNYKPDQTVISGTITDWAESGPVIAIGDDANHVSLWWSINTLDRGWFYGSAFTGDSDVALASGVTEVTQISDACVYNFTSGAIGPFCDADCDP